MVNRVNDLADLANELSANNKDYNRIINSMNYVINNARSIDKNIHNNSFTHDDFNALKTLFYEFDINSHIDKKTYEFNIPRLNLHDSLNLIVDKYHEKPSIISLTGKSFSGKSYSLNALESLSNMNIIDEFKVEFQNSSTYLPATIDVLKSNGFSTIVSDPSIPVEIINPDFNFHIESSREQFINNLVYRVSDENLGQNPHKISMDKSLNMMVQAYPNNVDIYYEFLTFVHDHNKLNADYIIENF